MCLDLSTDYSWMEISPAVRTWFCGVVFDVLVRLLGFTLTGPTMQLTGRLKGTLSKAASQAPSTVLE